jgi:hypothetical protein
LHIHPYRAHEPFPLGRSNLAVKKDDRKLAARQATLRAGIEVSACFDDDRGETPNTTKEQQRRLEEAAVRLPGRSTQDAVGDRSLSPEQLVHMRYLWYRSIG